MTEPTTFGAVQEEYAGLTGRAAAVYGLSPLLGRLYGTLFLSPAPLTLDELAQAVGAAKSTTSVAMRQLETYRMVQRQWVKGDRRDFFAARIDALAILADWYRLFGQQELAYMAQANAAARQALQAAPAGAACNAWPSAEQRATLLERLRRFDGAMALFRTWGEQFLAAAPHEPAPAETIAIEVEE